MKKRVTVIVVIRERFSHTKKSLESIYNNTSFPFDLIYVDCNSPSKIKQYLEIQAKEKGFNLIRLERYISQNQARNIALACLKTEYVVFIDNDILVKQYWLDALVRCADETGAWVVGPLCLEGSDFQKVHMASGTFTIKQRGIKQWIAIRRPYFKTPLIQIQNEFKRQPCDIVEFHCCLARIDVFEKLGLLDERIMNVGNEEDLCLTVINAGKPIFFEPASVISYIRPEKLALSDIPFFFTHWSQAWYQVSIDRLQEKWNIDECSPLIKGYGVFLKGQKYSICKKPQKAMNDLSYPLKKALFKLAEKIYNLKAYSLLSKTRENL
jgi:GT2 family glycosyltransferase